MGCRDNKFPGTDALFRSVGFAPSDMPAARITSDEGSDAAQTEVCGRYGRCHRVRELLHAVRESYDLAGGRRLPRKPENH